MKGVDECGLTLVELLVSTVIALIVLAGLLVSFQSQYGEYKYQNKRVDAAQDMEFALSFIAADLQAALVRGAVGVTDPNPVENNNFTGAAATSSLTFWVWDTAEAAADLYSEVVQRKYQYVYNATEGRMILGYDRAIATKDPGGTINTAGFADTSSWLSNEVMPNVTFFKVFKDDIGLKAGKNERDPLVYPLKNFPDMPEPLAPRVIAPAGMGDLGNPPATFTVPSYTILIEVAVDAGYKNGSFFNVKGDDVRIVNNVQGKIDKRKRLWRYVQVQPRSTDQ